MQQTAVSLEALRFLDASKVREVASSIGTPAYVYDEATLKRQATTALSFPNAYGLTVRFAMKASPNAAILKTFDTLGLHIDASSGFEVRRAVAAGVDAGRISLSTQECPEDLDELLALGIKFNACSLSQLERYGELRPGVRDCSHWCLPGVPDVWNQFLQHTLRCRACENGGKCRPAYVQDC